MACACFMSVLWREHHLLYKKCVSFLRHITTWLCYEYITLMLGRLHAHIHQQKWKMSCPCFICPCIQHLTHKVWKGFVSLNCMSNIWIFEQICIRLPSCKVKTSTLSLFVCMVIFSNKWEPCYCCYHLKFHVYQNHLPLKAKMWVIPSSFVDFF